MRKASLGTLFLTVFLDLLGFGLVVPFLPGVARAYGASNFEATLLGAAFSAMQFLFIPLWGRLSDRIGRRPVLLWSIAASAIGMVVLGFAPSLTMLFVARLWSGMATANIAVAQAYIADVTTPERRARGMGLIGMAFGLGFIFGPFVGGELGRFSLLGRPGALAALVAAGLSAVNLVMALFLLPESLSGRPAEFASKPRRAVPLDPDAIRLAGSTPGVALAVAIGFSVTVWFAGMEQTFRLFTEDAFGLNVASTGRIFGLLGLVTALVQGGLIHRLTRRFGEVRLVRAGAPVLAVGLARARTGGVARGLVHARARLWLAQPQPVQLHVAPGGPARARRRAGRSAVDERAGASARTGGRRSALPVPRHARALCRGRSGNVRRRVARAGLAAAGGVAPAGHDRASLTISR
jgi:DHA1 family tetracycline resistance protein-like MFS transporter